MYNEITVLRALSIDEVGWAKQLFIEEIFCVCWIRPMEQIQIIKYQKSAWTKSREQPIFLINSQLWLYCIVVRIVTFNKAKLLRYIKVHGCSKSLEISFILRFDNLITLVFLFAIVSILAVLRMKLKCISLWGHVYIINKIKIDEEAKVNTVKYRILAALLVCTKF